MEIFDVFSMNGIENYPAAGEIFLENVILKVSQTHFPKDLYPKGGGGGGGINFSRGGNAPPPRGGCEVPCIFVHIILICLKIKFTRRGRPEFQSNPIQDTLNFE